LNGLYIRDVGAVDDCHDDGKNRHGHEHFQEREASQIFSL
jgi:hypothetical protein